MNLILGLAAFTGLLLSLAVHVASLAHVDVASAYPEVWLLHVGIFLVFIPFVFLSRRTLGAKPSLATVKAAFPMSLVAIGCVLIAYTALNFLLFFLASDGGSPAIKDGSFVLQEHGHFIRQLSSAEYTRYRANELRGFSGHWLLFYFVPFAYFLFRRDAVA